VLRIGTTAGLGQISHWQLSDGLGGTTLRSGHDVLERLQVRWAMTGHAQAQMIRGQVLSEQMDAVVVAAKFIATQHACSRSLSAKRDPAQGAFGGVVQKADAAIVEELREGWSALQHIVVLPH
jgi:hypothetical protein